MRSNAIIKTFLALVFLSIFVLLTGCYRNGLYVQEEWVDLEFLASSHVMSPDPRREHPPVGQRLLIGWDLPRSLMQSTPSLHIDVWLWDNTVHTFYHSLERKRGSYTLFFPDDEEGKDRRILTYRVQVVSSQGAVLRSWEHHFWTRKIDIDSFGKHTQTTSKIGQ